MRPTKLRIGSCCKVSGPHEICGKGESEHVGVHQAAITGSTHGVKVEALLVVPERDLADLAVVESHRVGNVQELMGRNSASA